MRQNTKQSEDHQFAYIRELCIGIPILSLLCQGGHKIRDACLMVIDRLGTRGQVKENLVVGECGSGQIFTQTDREDVVDNL